MLLVEALNGGSFATFDLLLAIEMPQVFPRSDYNGHNRIAVHMRNLRRKGIKIESVRGIGYKLV